MQRKRMGMRMVQRTSQVQTFRQRRIVAITSAALLTIFGVVFFFNVSQHEEAMAANTVTWTNGNGTFNWNDPLNWNTGAVPGTNDIATFNSGSGNCNINANANVSGIAITTGYSGTITQQSGRTITIGVSGFSQSCAAFAGGNSSIDINAGTFSISGGAFTSTTGTLYIGGNVNANATLFTHSSGTFNHNNGTVIFDPAVNGWVGSPTFTVDISNSTSFYNVTVNASTCCNTATFATASGDTIDVSNDLTHADGFISGMLEVKNNFAVSANTDGGSGTIVINGTGAQTYSTTGTHRTCHVYVDKSSGSFIAAVGTTNLYTQKFTLANGDFTAPTGTLAAGGNYNSSLTLFTHAGGTFNAGGGTVLIDPTVTGWTGSPTFTIDVLNATSFYNVSLKGSTCCNTVTLATASGDTVDATNDFTHQDGFISGLFEVKNNLAVSSGTDGGNGTIIVDGTGAQTYSTTGTHRTCHIYIDKSAGTFAPAGGTSSFYMQKFTLANGTYTAPTGIMAAGGSWNSSETLFTHTGGTFNSNTGTVSIDPAVSGWTGSPTFTMDVISSTSFYNVTVSASTCCNTATVTAGSGDTIDVTNDLTHADGFLAATMEVKQNLIVNSGTDGGSGTIIINGSTAQTYASSGTHRTCHIYVDKSASSFAAAGGTSALYMQKFTLAAGTFTAPSGTMAVGGSWNSSLTLFTQSGGTFDANSGTVSFDPAVSGWTGSPTFTLDVLSATSFYNITLNASTCCNTATIATAAGDTVEAFHNLSHADGFISGTFEVRNDLSVSAGTDGGSGTIIVDGTATQTYAATGTHRTCHIYVDKPSGIFQALGGTANFYMQKFTMANGTFTAPSGIMAIGGAWNSSQTLFTHSGGTFNDNNGSISLDPAVSGWVGSPTFTLDVISSTQLYDLTLNASTCCNLATIATASGDTVEAKNNLTHTDGFISGAFQVKNNLTVNANTDGGSGVIVVDGTGAQTYATSGTHLTCHVYINKTSGGFSAASGTSSFYVQKFTLANGTFTAPTANLAVGGAWNSNQTLFTHSGGTFAANGGTLLLNPAVSGWVGSPTFTVDVLNTTTFNTVNINASTCCNTATLVTASNDSIDAVTVTYTDGRVTGIVEASGTVTVASGHDGGNGKLIFKGSSDQNFDLTGATALFDGDIVVNKTSGKVNLLSSCILNSATQRMTFTKGIIVSTASNLLTYGDNFTLTGASDSGFVQGPVSKIGNDIFTFPTGVNDTIYAALRISAPASTTAQFTAEYIHSDPSSLYNRTLKDASLVNVSACEYWTLNQVAGSSTVTVSLSWGNARSCGVSVPSELSVARWDGSMWRDRGNGGAVGTTSGTLPSASTTNAFGPFTLGSSTGNNALPIELISFTAIYNNNQVDLKWVTATERDNDYFTLEKSRNLTDITEVKRVRGAGTSVVALTYDDADEDPFDGLSYYRLKQTDYDGKFAYSEWVKVMVKKSSGEPMVKIYPNPCDGMNINLEVTDLKNVMLNVSLADLSGKQIFSRTINAESDHELMQLGHPQQLLPGTYVVSIIGDENKFSYKLVVK